MVRTFTPEEAIATLPRLRPLLAQLREAWHAHAFARDQAEDLRRMLGEAADDPAHPDHAELARWEEEARLLERRVQGLAREVEALGAEIKDPVMGLVDFYARRGDEVVYLCYRDDEPTLAHWHPLTTGFAGRRPLSEL